MNLGVGVWHLIAICYVLCTCTCVLHTDSEASGDGEADFQRGKKVSLKLMFGVVFGTVVITTVVVVCVLTMAYKIRWRQRRDSPQYLGSCRNINGVHSKSGCSQCACTRGRLYVHAHNGKSPRRTIAPPNIDFLNGQLIL